jgi:hypothetical protein
VTLPKDQAELLKVLAPLIEEYLVETKIGVNIVEYLQELVISAIEIDGTLIGFWGLRVRPLLKGKLATVKAIYFRKQYRGQYLNRAADDFIRKLSEQGVTELEIWAYPQILRWLEKRYGVQPKIYVTHNPIEIFQV